MKIFVILTMVLALTACHRVTYVSPSKVPTGQVVEESGSYFVLGLIGEEVIDATKLCPEGVARIQSGFKFTDLLLLVVTLTIYTPRTYRIHCGRGAAQ